MSTKLWGFEHKPDWPLLKWARELKEDVIGGREKVALLVYAKFAILLSYSHHSVVILHSKSTLFSLRYFSLKCKVVCSYVCVWFFFFFFFFGGVGGWGLRSFLLYMNLNGCSPIFTMLLWFLGFHHKLPNMSYDCGYSLFLGNYYHERDFDSNSRWNIRWFLNKLLVTT